MVGGLLQIVIYGAQDVYLTNNPQITFFKTVFRRHTNFSIEAFEYTVQDGPNFGTKNEVILHRNGDLITKMYIRIVVDSVNVPENANFAWIRRFGHAILNYVEITIEGVRIDRLVGTWLDIWYELARTGKHDRGYLKMIGDDPKLTTYNEINKPEFTVFIPLKFWFNKFIGLSIPMIGILYHRIIIKMEFNDAENVIVRNSNFTFANINELQFLDVTLIIDFIFLDDDERRRFAQIGHEYLIEQVQFTGEESIDAMVRETDLHFNHPCKEMVWAIKNGNYTSGKAFLCYTNNDDWRIVLESCAGDILQNSILLLDAPQFDIDEQGNQIIVEPGDDPPVDLGGNSTWEEFQPGSNNDTTSNGKINATNNSITKTLWINTSSLLIGTYNLFDKISSTITVSSDDTIMISDLATTLTVRDISIPVEMMTDTRVDSDDVFINIFSNYGLFIDGKHNPIEYSLLKFNEVNRFDKRGGNFFNYLQPELHHSNTPKDGVNVYSFCINPEVHQPTGSANFSTVDEIIFTIWINDKTKTDNLPDLNIINEDSRLYIFALSYNVLKISNGLAGLSYIG